MEIALACAVILLATAVCWLLLRRGGRTHLVDAEQFPCRVELVSGTVPGLRVGRVRRATAAWCHTALLLRGRTLASPELWALGVHFPTGRVERLRADEARGMGADAVALTFQLDDGPRLRVVVRRWDAERLAGPFLAAVIETQDRGPGRGRPDRQS